jgi:redox-sensitive bicupin YhaK (pirin superfamily)
MITVRKAEDRGHFDHGWLDTNHTFSFADYHDPQHMGWSSLRVLNEDRVQGGRGFPPHAHRDMEIVTYVLEGALQHRDSMGNGSVIRPGEIQRMSAGTGVVHSEHNTSESEPVHFLQIWILPDRRGLEPSYEQKLVAAEGGLRLIGAPHGGDAAVTIHQDVRLYVATPRRGETVHLDLDVGRKAWVQVARGSASLNGEPLQAGDGAAIDGERQLELTAMGGAAEVLLFDLPA